MTSRMLALATCTLLTLVASGQPATLPAPDKLRAFGGIQPRLSPDAKWIAVSHQGAIAKLPADGGTLTILTRDEGWDIEPAWSPDGKRIAYINSPNFRAGQLRIMDAHDGSPVKLPKAIRAQGSLFFHPDGKRLLGKFSISGAPDSVAWVDLASGDVTPVAGVPDSWAARLRGAYALSHDGSFILFAETQDIEGQQGGNNGPQADLWRIPSSGGEAQHIVRWPARIYSLAWDADDHGCLAVTDVGVPHNDLWRIPLKEAARDAKKLTFGQADEDGPATAPGGDTLVFTENSEGATALVVHKPTGSAHVTMDRIDFRSETGLLTLKVTETDGSPTVARVSLRRLGGKFHAPPEALYRITAGLGHFYCRGSAQFDLPAGRYELLAFRGPEYRVARREFEISGGQAHSLTVPLERWVNAAAEGWFSGENHIHANYGYGAWYNTPRTILEQCEGEDLRVCNLVVANSDGDAVFDREFFRGRPDPLSTPDTILYWNQEFRSTLWGHMTLFDLDQLVEPVFTGFKDTTNPWDIPTNADIAQRARDQGGTASYTHPSGNADDWYDQPYSAKGLPVDAALGRIHTMDVMGFTYWACTGYWYQLLNCGFRIPAAAGTDCFLNRIPASPPGWGRVYVHLPDGLGYDKWIAGLKAGRSFVSNGPIIEFTANGRTLGETLQLDGPAEVQVKGRARSQFPLDSLELMHNGRVIANGRLSDDKLTATFDQPVRIETGGWIALRTSGPIPRYWTGRTLAAHTNPIYVEVQGRPQERRAEAAYFLKWIDRLEADVKRRNRTQTETGARHVQMQLDAARKTYQSLAR
jgi:TolB protein